MLVLATIAMLGLSSAAFAENAVPAMKEGAQLTHTQASVIHKRRLSHRVGARKFDVAYTTTRIIKSGKPRIKPTATARKACRSMQVPTGRCEQRRPSDIASEVNVGGLGDRGHLCECSGL
jgi:hypothetical protein